MYIVNVPESMHFEERMFEGVSCQPHSTDFRDRRRGSIDYTVHTRVDVLFQ